MSLKNCRIFLWIVVGLIAQRIARADGRIWIQSPGDVYAAMVSGKLHAADGSTLQPPLNSNGSFTVATTTSSGGATYNFGVDPDLTHNTMDITLDIPQLYSASDPLGIQDFEITLVDTQQKMRTWQWDTAALVQGAQTFDFALIDGRGAGKSTSFSDNGLDLKQVQQVDFSFNGVPYVSPQLPAGGLLLQVNSIAEVPEPGAMVTLALGIMGFAGWGLSSRRRRCAAAGRSQLATP